MEERQAVGVRRERTVGRAALRRGVVQQQEARVRRDDVQGRREGGGKVQEQRTDTLQQEDATVPHPLVEAARPVGKLGDDGAASGRGGAAEGRHRGVEVSPGVGLGGRGGRVEGKG